MNRAEALAAAKSFVDELAPYANSRGYADGTIKPAERVDLIVKVADWLLGGQDGPAPLAIGPDCHICGGGSGQIVACPDPGQYAGKYMHAYGACNTNGFLS